MTSSRSRVAILGTGNIGTDLLVKAVKSKNLDCVLFTGRNLRSDGMMKASEFGVRISDLGVRAIVEAEEDIDIVFDATSAAAHMEHWPILQALGRVVIDMTPAKVGHLCVPAINAYELVRGGMKNINMVTCGGQASIPIAKAISTVHQEIEYIEVASSISSRSAGPATRANLDEYIETTQDALVNFTGCQRAKAILILNPARPPIDMQTTIYAKIRDPDIYAICQAVDAMTKTIEAYVPGYELIVPPTIDGGKVVTTIKVKGNGDYLPSYAGNLDIINCAAIDIAERIATHLGE